MAKKNDLANLPIDEFYNELGNQLDQFSVLIDMVLNLLVAATDRMNQLEQRIVALEQSAPI